MDLIGGKVVTIFVFLFGELLATFLPAVYIRRRSVGLNTSDVRSFAQLVLDSCYSIAGGVLLATCFVALIPFVRELFDKAIQAKGLSNNKPYGEFTVVIGFFLILFIEKAISYYNNSNNSNERKDGAGKKPVGIEEESLLSADDLSDQPSQSNHSNRTSNLPMLLHSMMLAVTLAIHTLFEGVSIGLISDLDLLITLVTAVLIHAISCAIALGINIGRQRLSTIATGIISLAYSLMMPIGIAIGVGLGNIQGFTGLLVAAIVQGLATGTFLYVLFVEIIPSISSAKHSIIQTLLMLAGCVFMTIITLLTHHVDSTTNSTAVVLSQNKSDFLSPP